MTDELDCKAASRLLSADLDGKLGAPELLRLQEHLAICEPCRHAKDQLQFIRLAMRRLGSH